MESTMKQSVKKVIFCQYFIWMPLPREEISPVLTVAQTPSTSTSHHQTTVSEHHTTSCFVWVLHLLVTICHTAMHQILACLCLCALTIWTSVAMNKYIDSKCTMSAAGVPCEGWHPTNCSPSADLATNICHGQRPHFYVIDMHGDTYPLSNLPLKCFATSFQYCITPAVTAVTVPPHCASNRTTTISYCIHWCMYVDVVTCMPVTVIIVL